MARNDGDDEYATDGIAAEEEDFSNAIRAADDRDAVRKECLLAMRPTIGAVAKGKVMVMMMEMF